MYCHSRLKKLYFYILRIKLKLFMFPPGTLGNIWNCQFRFLGVYPISKHYLAQMRNQMYFFPDWMLFGILITHILKDSGQAPHTQCTLLMQQLTHINVDLRLWYSVCLFTSVQLNIHPLCVYLKHTQDFTEKHKSLTI